MNKEKKIHFKAICVTQFLLLWGERDFYYIWWSFSSEIIFKHCFKTFFIYLVPPPTTHTQEKCSEPHPKPNFSAEKYPTQPITGH